MSNIIDVESLIYKASTASEQIVEIASGIYSVQYSMKKVQDFFESLFNDVAGVTDDDDFIMVFGDKNFRKVLNEDYKSNRADQRKHIMLPIVRDYIRNNFSTYSVEWLEADDVCRILYESNPFKNVIVSIDKDLRTFPVKVLNPDKLDEGVVKIDKDEANYNFATQLIMGDKTDGYNGVPGYGEAKTKKLLDSCNEELTIKKIRDLFVEAGGSNIEFIRTYNMARIISRNDYYEGVGIKLYNTCFDFNKGVQVEKL